MGVTPREAMRAAARPELPYAATASPPPHLSSWQLPPDWRWGNEGRLMEHRHFQEIIDALGRSLSLVSTPNPAHEHWLAAEARALAHLNHPAIPTTYHYWAPYRGTLRGPGYLRRWLAAESVGDFVRRSGLADIPLVFRVLRAVGSTLSYLHDSGTIHGAVSLENVWIAPAGRTWMLGWQWAIPRADIPDSLEPNQRWMPFAPEWTTGGWQPTRASDQWQLAGMCFAALTGEPPPSKDIPPVQFVRPDCPDALASVVDTALHEDPTQRYRSVSLLLRALEHTVAARSVRLGTATAPNELSEEERLRWATSDDYHVLGFLGSGTFGSVWRVRDLTLEREVALKMLHPEVAQHPVTVARFLREARLAAQLAHPGIIPIYDLDARGDVTWYTMELAEAGSVADLIARSGPRPFDEIAPKVDAVLDALSAAHASGIVHRDLKPENILIDRYRRWRVTDFGIAKGEDELAGTTGTPAFAAPEQLLGESQGPSVDCFAMGGIVAFALTGQPPFTGTDAKVILAKQLAGDYDSARFEAPVRRFLDRALTADTESRYADAKAMKTAWRELRQAMQRRETTRSGWFNRILRSGQS